MARAFILHEEDALDDDAVSAVHSRERELSFYDRNIVSYTQQLVAMAALPADWPPQIVMLRGLPNEQVHALAATEADAQLASALNHRDRVRMLLFTEKAEMKKSEYSYNALLGQLPTGPRRSQAIARLKAKPQV